MIVNSNMEKSVSLINQRVNPFVIYLFGSAARNELRSDSDIDLAYIGQDSLDDYENFLLSQEIADIFKRDVDLVDLNKASTVFKAQVVGNGKVLFCNDESKRMFFEMRTLKEYAMLNEERAEILKYIKESGRVYGK